MINKSLIVVCVCAILFCLSELVPNGMWLQIFMLMLATSGLTVAFYPPKQD